MTTSLHLRRGVLGSAAIAVLLTASLAFTASSGAAVVPLTTSLTIDCTAGLPAQRIYWTPNTQTVAVTITNCTTYEVFDADYNSIDSGSGASASLTLGNEILQLDSDYDKEFYFRPVYPQHVPTGELLTARTFDLPLSAPTMDVGADNSGGDGDHWLGGDSTCALQSNDPEPSDHVYSTIPIEVLVGGTYTFRGIDSTPPGSYVSSLTASNELEDPFLALYTTFDPSNTDSGIVGCNDDLNDLFDYDNIQMAEQLATGVVMEGHQPYFSSVLQPGRYVLVLTTYIAIDSADWATQGPGDVKFEMWGPKCGLDISDDPGCRATPAPDDPVVPGFTG